MYAGGGRVELSGATTANWVAKSANLLVDSLGQPERIGLLLPLHWQTVCLALAGITTGATVVLATNPAELSGCEVAFVLAGDAEDALGAGVDEVLALSGHPMGAPSGALPPMVLDYAREVPGHGDHYGGARPTSADLRWLAQPVEPEPGLTAADRVLTGLPPSDLRGAAVLLGALACGASLVLLDDPTADPDAIVTAERVTRSFR